MSREDIQAALDHFQLTEFSQEDMDLLQVLSLNFDIEGTTLPDLGYCPAPQVILLCATGTRSKAYLARSASCILI